MERYRSYAGIGSRSTPAEAQRVMQDMAETLGSHDVVLRTGAAPGADSAFERGCDRANGPKEVFVPWEGFEGRRSDERGLYPLSGLSLATRASCLSIARSVHPAWHRLNRGARQLHARNVLQILGADLRQPVSFVICWTPGGRSVGGTRTAIWLAAAQGVPCFNLATRDWTLKEIVTVVLSRRCRHCGLFRCYCCLSCGQHVAEHDSSCEHTRSASAEA